MFAKFTTSKTQNRRSQTKNEALIQITVNKRKFAEKDRIMKIRIKSLQIISGNLAT